MLGIESEDTHFDNELILHINTALAVLTQLGVGSKKGFEITSAADIWDTFMGSDPRLGMVKSYVHKKVQILFDPPASSAHIEAINRTLGELEFRILSQADANRIEEENNG